MFIKRNWVLSICSLLMSRYMSRTSHDVDREQRTTQAYEERWFLQEDLKFKFLAGYFLDIFIYKNQMLWMIPGLTTQNWQALTIVGSRFRCEQLLFYKRKNAISTQRLFLLTTSQVPVLNYNWLIMRVTLWFYFFYSFKITAQSHPEVNLEVIKLKRLG